MPQAGIRNLVPSSKAYSITPTMKLTNPSGRSAVLPLRGGTPYGLLLCLTRGATQSTLAQQGQRPSVFIRTSI